MKVLVATLATLLLMDICSPVKIHLGDSSVAETSKMPGEPTFCCTSYMQRRIPHSFITSAFMTSRMCSQPGAILVTKKGRMVCADPQEKWVQVYLKYFQRQES